MKQAIETYQFAGMQKDMSLTNFPNSFLYDALNVRFHTRDNLSTLNLTNEKGAKKVFDMLGYVLGYQNVGKYLVVFTHHNNDHIYRINLDTEEIVDLIDPGMELGFDIHHHIRSIGSFEGETIQKVYWTDNKNSPRMINIVDPNLSQHITDTNYFDFDKELELNESVSVRKQFGVSAFFEAGVIQYCFTYFNKFGVETGIFYTTPLLYISSKQNGNAPDDIVNVAFRINASGLERKFDYVRIYSIVRTSINGTPKCKRVIDIEVSADGTIEYIDNNTAGETIEFDSLLHKGSEKIRALTMDAKDNTLFLGNISLDRKDDYNWEEESDNIRNEITLSQSSRMMYTQGGGDYPNWLNATDEPNGKLVSCGGFKTGNYYRCGVQFQHKSGTWSTPVFLGDVPIENKPVYIRNLDNGNSQIRVPAIEGVITAEQSAILIDAGYLKIRAVIAEPSKKDRVVLFQGVANPTIWGLKELLDQKILCVSSWFFRPYTHDDYQSDAAINYLHTPVTNRTLSGKRLLPWFGDYLADDFLHPDNDNPDREVDKMPEFIEIQGNYDGNDGIMPAVVCGNVVEGKKTFSTLHSPDITFDESLYSLEMLENNIAFINIGVVDFYKTDASFSLLTSSAPVKGKGAVSFTASGSYANGVISCLGFEDYALDGDDLVADDKLYSPFKWLVYPWHKQGSMNNDRNRTATEGARTAVLGKKIVANKRYSNTIFFDDRSHVWTSGSMPGQFTGDPKIVVEDDCLYEVEDDGYLGCLEFMTQPTSIQSLIMAIGEEPFPTFDGNSVDLPYATQKTFRGTNTPLYSNGWLQFWYGKALAYEGGSRLWEFTGSFIRSYDFTDEKWYGNPIDAEMQIPDGAQDVLLCPIEDEDLSCAFFKDNVMMKFNSSPHLAVRGIFSTPSVKPASYNSILPLYDVVVKGDGSRPLEPYYRASLYGGTTDDAIRQNLWIPAGEPKRLDSNAATSFKYEYGDTYYGRYDCLKTYPKTAEDKNQVIEIGSFVIESYINTNGRYDANITIKDNTIVTNENFNKLNMVYSQQNNFFSYRIIDKEIASLSVFPHQITWTLPKQAGEEIDTWTNITLQATADANGVYGAIKSINYFKDRLYMFQDNAISIIQFNSRTQIPTDDGSSISLANSGKFESIRYINTNIGCDSQFKIVSSADLLYFLETSSSRLSIVNGTETKDLGIAFKMKSWFNDEYDNLINSRLLYDGINKDVYITPQSPDEDYSLGSKNCIDFSEIVNAFTSFYTYSGLYGLTTYRNNIYALRNAENGSMLYKMFDGEYNKPWSDGDLYPWYFEFISNGISQGMNTVSKIFTNITFMLDMFDGDEYKADAAPQLMAFETEYQSKYDYIYRLLNDSTKSSHHKDNNLQKKYKTWRITIPRASSPEKPRLYDRFCNSHLKIKIKSWAEQDKEPDLDLKAYITNQNKAELRNISVTFFNL